MWVRAEDTFMTNYFDRTGDAFEIEHLSAALAHCPGRRFALDVGAQYGSWSRHLGRQFAKVNAWLVVRCGSISRRLGASSMSTRSKPID
jgi:hypothetical protein